METCSIQPRERDTGDLYDLSRQNLDGDSDESQRRHERYGGL
jgi:hypothetical protein